MNGFVRIDGKYYNLAQIQWVHLRPSAVVVKFVGLPRQHRLPEPYASRLRAEIEGEKPAGRRPSAN